MKENVWDYLRPATCRQFAGKVAVIVGVVVVAKSSSVFRTLETSHPTTYQFPGNDVNFQNLVKNDRSTLCGWKARARYFSYITPQDVIHDIGWCYINPTKSF